MYSYFKALPKNLFIFKAFVRNLHREHTPFSPVLSSPVVFELGQHDPCSFHANVDALHVKAEGVRKLHSHNHLLTHFASFRYLKYTKDII